MNLKKIRFIILYLLVFLPAIMVAQDCSTFVDYYVPEFPYKYNGQSKSATCTQGKTYKFVVTLMKGNDYRISFYASTVFNNKINFKIIDENESKVVMELPGESEDAERKGSVLVPTAFFDKENYYPYFEFFPQNSLNLRLQIEILPGREGEDPKRGCVGVLILEKKSETDGFENVNIQEE